MAEGDQGEANPRTLSDYARATWRWKWLILIVAVACGVAGYYYSWRQAPQYLATALLTYQQPIDSTNPLQNVDPLVAQTALENVANAVSSPTVASRAEAILGGTAAHPYGVSAALAGSTASGYSNVETLSVVSTDAAESAAVANAYARAVTGWSRDQQLARVRDAETATSDMLKTFESAGSKSSVDYILLRQRLESLRILGSTVTGEFQVLAAATVPAEAFAPRPKRSAAVGFGAGLLAAVALVLLFEVFSTRVRGRHDVAEALDLPILGVVPKISSKMLDGNKLITLTQPDGSVAEAFRLIRSNLDYVNVDDVSSFLVTSALADEAKSLMVCNLAVTMAMAGKKIVVVEGDLRKPRVHEYFNMSNDVGLSSVAAGTASLADALRAVDLPATLRGSTDGNGPNPDASVRITGDRRLVVLTAGPPVADPGELVASKRFGSIIRDLQKSNVDFVIVDSPALLEVGDATAMAAQVDALVMVVDLDKVTRPLLLEARESLAPLPCRKLGSVVISSKHGRRGDYMDGG